MGIHLSNPLIYNMKFIVFTFLFGLAAAGVLPIAPVGLGYSGLGGLGLGGLGDGGLGYGGLGLGGLHGGLGLGYSGLGLGGFGYAGPLHSYSTYGHGLGLGLVGK